MPFSRFVEPSLKKLQHEPRDWRILAIVIAGLIIAAVIWQWRMSFPFDDAYITFRYAENVANGHGLVWNSSGPHTEGYTNFLFVLILVPFVLFHADLMIVSQLIGIVSTILTALVIFKIVKYVSASRVWPLAAAFLYLLLPFTWANAFSAMETSLFAFIVTASFYFAEKKAWRNAFMLAALSCLVRPDGALAGVILLLYVLLGIPDRTDRSNALRAGLLYLVIPMLLYAVFKLFYFGNLLPNAFYIKTGPGFHGIQGFKDFARGHLILLILAAYSFWRFSDRRNNLLPIVLWSCTLGIFYLWPEPLQGFYYRFDWPIMPALVMFAACAVSTERWNARSAILLTLVIAAQIALSIPRLHVDMDRATNQGGRQIYRELGLALQALPNHEQMTFAFQDAGAVPFYSEMRNIDLVGLNTTALAKAHSVFEECNIIDSLQPAIMLIPAYHDTGTCWNVFNVGHGKAGALIPELVHGSLMNHYVCVGRIAYLGYDILCYVTPTYATSVGSELAKYEWFVPGPIPCLQ